MIEFGKTLCEAREAKGYSTSQLADITHILPQIIENLEHEDFSKIVAPIYGRGFVKLYCEAVGLDAKPLIEEFMAIYNGERPPVIRMRDSGQAVQQPPETPSETAPEPTSEPAAFRPPAEPEVPAAPEPKGLSLAELPPIDPAPLSRMHETAQPTTAGANDLPLPDADRPAPKRDYRLPGYSLPEVPRSFWRFGILICAAAAVVTLLVLGCRFLYRATMRAPDQAPAAETDGPKPNEAPVPEATPKAEAPRNPRKPIAVPPLYID